MPMHLPSHAPWPHIPHPGMCTPTTGRRTRGDRQAAARATITRDGIGWQGRWTRAHASHGREGVMKDGGTTLTCSSRSSTLMTSWNLPSLIHVYTVAVNCPSGTAFGCPCAFIAPSGMAVPGIAVIMAADRLLPPAYNHTPSAVRTRRALHRRCAGEGEERSLYAVDLKCDTTRWQAAGAACSTRGRRWWDPWGRVHVRVLKREGCFRRRVVR